MENHRQGDWFDLRAGCFCGQPPLHSDVVPPTEADNIQLLLRMNFSTMHLFRMDRKERNRMAETILHYYRLHLPDFSEMKSFAVLKELFWQWKDGHWPWKDFSEKKWRYLHKPAKVSSLIIKDTFNVRWRCIRFFLMPKGSSQCLKSPFRRPCLPTVCWQCPSPCPCLSCPEHQCLQ